MKDGAPQLYQFCKVSDKRKLDHLKNNDKFDIPKNQIRTEMSRTWLLDSPQPRRSIFNFNDHRHEEFVTKDELRKNNALIAKNKTLFQGCSVGIEPTRKQYDWVPSPNNRVLASPKRLEITGKIGH